jgi:hypothetical protein
MLKYVDYHHNGNTVAMIVHEAPARPARDGNPAEREYGFDARTGKADLAYPPGHPDEGRLIVGGCPRYSGTGKKCGTYEFVEEPTPAAKRAAARKPKAADTPEIPEGGDAES